MRLQWVHTSCIRTRCQGLHQGRVGPRPSFFRIKPENTGRVGAAEKDKPEKTGRVGAAKKDKPEKTGRVGSAEIGGKTGSGRVRVGLTRFFFPFFSAINRSDIGSSKYTAIRDPARCREAHEAPYLHREHHDKLRGRWAGGSCNRDM